MHIPRIRLAAAIGLAALALTTGGAAALGNDGPDKVDPPSTANETRAAAAALAFTGGGTIVDVDTLSPRKGYRVGLALDDGRDVEVTVDPAFKVSLCTVDDVDPKPVIDPGDCGFYNPLVDPANFVAEITNRYLPLKPGSRWVYETDDGVEHIEVEVLHETRTILGIQATVVQDNVYEDGSLIEATFDWFAQDKQGNVWYLGEDSAEVLNGEIINRHGSWEAGVDGAKPGITMWANPMPRMAYRQEFYEGEAEDLAKVLRRFVKKQVRGHAYHNLVVIQEWTPLGPIPIEDKYYAPGIGKVLELKVRGGPSRLELIEFVPAP